MTARWTPADRELVVGVLWTRACQGGNAGVRMDPQPARDAPMRYWADAAALLDALAAAGKLAGPDHDARVRADERARVAEEIALHFDERRETSTGIPPFRAAQITRQHATTPTTTEGDPRRTGRVVDPHHAIIADGITVATVPCASDCPPEHFRPTEGDPDATT